MSRAVLELVQVLGLLCGIPGAILLRIGLGNKAGSALVGRLALTVGSGIAGYAVPIPSWVLIPAAFVASGAPAHALNALTLALPVAIISFWSRKYDRTGYLLTCACIVLFMVALIASITAVGLIHQAIGQAIPFTVLTYGILLGLFASLLLMLLGMSMIQQLGTINSRIAQRAGVLLSALAAIGLFLPSALDLFRLG